MYMLKEMFKKHGGFTKWKRFNPKETKEHKKSVCYESLK